MENKQLRGVERIRWGRCLLCTLVVALAFGVIGTGPAVADEDPAEYCVVIEPGFATNGESYARFETPEYLLEQPLDSLLLTTDLETSPTATVRSYVRLRWAGSGTWSREVEFTGEFHYANPKRISGYQVLFVIRDDAKGQTVVKKLHVQGRQVGGDLLEKMLIKPAPFKAAKAWPKPAIVSRAEWGARPPKNTYTQHQVLRLVLHHTWKPTQQQYNGAATIKGIQNYHMDGAETGWSDIGYHFLIGPDGVIYQGRPETVVGAHVQPNTNAVGICVIGDYDPGQDSNNEKIERSLIDLLSWLSSKYGVDPKAQYYGHRDFSSKSCPGDGIYLRLPYYRSKVLENIGKQ